MNLNGINLNLLVTLDAILKEKSLTKASKRLRISQPALSHNLKTLREIFDDELLFKGASNRMILTPKAKSILEPLNQVLSKIQTILDNTDTFDPAECIYNFKIGMSDYASTLVLPKLLKVLNNYSDNITVNVKHLNSFADFKSFEYSNLDFAIGFYDNHSSNIFYRNLFNTNLVCVGRKKHPAFKKDKISINDFLSYPHIQPVFRDDLSNLYSSEIKLLSGRFRKLMFTVPHLMTALNIISQGDYLCIVHENIVAQYKDRFDLDFRDLPFSTPVMEYSIYWPRENDNNHAHKWFRNIIIENCSGL